MSIHIVVSVNYDDSDHHGHKVFAGYDKALAFAKEECDSCNYHYVVVKTFELNDDAYVETASVRLSDD